MLKYVVLASVMSVSAPALAQTAPAQSMTPQSTQSAPATPDSTAMSAAPQAAQPADSAAAPAQDAVAATQPAAATQVADVVTKEFPSYDKNGDGTLSAKEFDTWMVALKTASDPSTKATAPATKTWLNQAFAQADTDKNKKVSQSELTGFLSQKG
ncbi:calcium-binding protein [Sphingomonas sp. HMWF008]|nr:calcium-binding protein [Sphingomonas sp. HMWF008]